MWKIIIILGIILLGFGAAIGTSYKTKLIPTLFVSFSVIFFTIGMIDLVTLYKSTVGALVVVLGIILIPIVFAWAIKGAEGHNVV